MDAVDASIRRLIGDAYADAAGGAMGQRRTQLRSLYDNKALPEQGWAQEAIDWWLAQLAAMDSNNFSGNVGVGEREARVFSPAVARRMGHLAHGMGRSGDVTAVQPKAAGSSLLVATAQFLVRDALKLAGFAPGAVKRCLVLPVATGMALTLCMLAMRATRPQTARHVLFLRVDQKSCLKSISTAGFTPVIVQNRAKGDELACTVDDVRAAVDACGGPDAVLCVMSNTSAFTPRTPDPVQQIAVACRELGIGHVINNAFGTQSRKAVNLVSEACLRGRVDAFVQSTDKNWMVPVGGSVVASADRAFVDSVSKVYPGRASIAPVLDLTVTLLLMGRAGYRRLLAERERLYDVFCERIGAVAERHGERLLVTPRNRVSVAISLAAWKGLADSRAVTHLGSMLFARCVSGTRVVSTTDEKEIGPSRIVGWGAHSDAYATPYLTMSCAVGITEADIDTFAQRLDNALADFARQVPRAAQ